MQMKKSHAAKATTEREIRQHQQLAESLIRQLTPGLQREKFTKLPKYSPDQGLITDPALLELILQPQDDPLNRTYFEVKSADLIKVFRVHEVDAFSKFGERVVGDEGLIVKRRRGLTCYLWAEALPDNSGWQLDWNEAPGKSVSEALFELLKRGQEDKTTPAWLI